MRGHSTITAFSAAFALGCLVLALRVWSLHGLQAEADQMRSEIRALRGVGLPGSPEGRGVAVPGVATAAPPAPAAGPGATAEGLSEKDEHALHWLEARVAGWEAGVAGSGGTDARTPFKIFPELVSAMAEMSVGGLEEVISRFRRDQEAGEDGAGHHAFDEIVRGVAVVTLSTEDPLRALENPAVWEDDEMLRHAFASYAQHDVRAAHEWLLDQLRRPADPDEHRSIATLRAFTLQTLNRPLVLGALHQDPAMLDDLLRGHEREERRKLLANAFAAAGGTAGNGAWWDQVMRSGEPDFREDVVIARVNGIVASGDLDALSRVLHEGSSVGIDRDAVVRGAVSSGQAHALSAIAAWLAENGSPEEQATHFPAVIETWAERDFNVAGAWLGGLAPSLARDAAVAEFARQVARIDGEAAMEWSGSISDGQVREDTTREVIDIWASRDPEGAGRAASEP